MIDWINSAPAAELAVELMGAFAPGGPHVNGMVSRYQCEQWLFRGYPPEPRRGLVWIGVSERDSVHRPVLEAFQVLEHAELIVGSGEEVWFASRLGTATLAAGKDAVRRRIEDRFGAQPVQDACDEPG